MRDHSSAHINSAIELAKNASRELIRPNPFVGALVINNNDEIIGRGFHKIWGEAHAEVFAIREAIENGADLANCTLYVTLEPCSHTGKTPPCTELIVSSGIRKVVIGSKDPNPLVNGIGMLQGAGIEVVLEESADAIELNREFFVNQRFKRPYIVAKAAITADHFMSRENGDSKWISSEESRAWAHVHCRSRVDAILTTARTVIADDAKLNVRVGQDEIERTAIVLDRKLELLRHKDLSIHYPRKESALYLVTENPEPTDTEEAIRYINGVYRNGEVELLSLFLELYKNHNMYAVLIEAGPRLLNRMLHEGLVDELVVFESSNRFSNPTDRYRLDLSYTNLMEAKTIMIDGPDRVTNFRRAMQ